MADQSVGVSGYQRRTKSGKTVQVKAYSQQRDDVLESLKAEGRVPLVAQPGQFPAGRSTPTTPAVAAAEDRIWAAKQATLAAQQRAAQKQQEAMLTPDPVADEDDLNEAAETLAALLGEMGK